MRRGASRHAASRHAGDGRWKWKRGAAARAYACGGIWACGGVTGVSCVGDRVLDSEPVLALVGGLPQPPFCAAEQAQGNQPAGGSVSWAAAGLRPWLGRRPGDKADGWVEDSTADCTVPLLSCTTAFPREPISSLSFQKLRTLSTTACRSNISGSGTPFVTFKADSDSFISLPFFASAGGPCSAMH